MAAAQELPTGTRMFARVLGPFLVIVDVTAVLRAPDTQAVLSEFEANSLWSWVAGAFVLILASSSSPLTSTGEAPRRSSSPCWAGLSHCADFCCSPSPRFSFRWPTA